VISAKADLVENWDSQILFVSHDVFLSLSLKVYQLRIDRS